MANQFDGVDGLPDADSLAPERDRNCIHCGQTGDVCERTLRFTRAEPCELDLDLCEGCLSDLVTESGTALR